jgi:SAM-dependent methyltransferase
MPIPVSLVPTSDTFDEARYLGSHPDVAAAVAAGHFPNGRRHFDLHGSREGRKLRCADLIQAAMQRKIERIAPLIRQDLPHARRGIKYDFITDAVRAETGISETAAIAGEDYPDYTVAMIEELRDGLILDCGAGRRNVYYENVVNLDIVDYDTTDVIAVGEHLPFQDDTFDGVLSFAVLEHVRDPFACAREIVRVLKPGGRLLCAVPFLWPLHGYPHHYYNMTHQGLRALFDGDMIIDRQFLGPLNLPIWGLAMIVQTWAAGLTGSTRDEFLNVPLRDFLRDPAALLSESWVKALSEEKNFEIASSTLLHAHKKL